MDIKGYKQKKKFKNFNAVVVQHEMDHLDGILFVDKILKTKKTPNK
ncbi:peptide deformylase [Patescibacteria group bacterium]|nr:peptide deformylase [Patescibacteria group bacterium]